MRRRNAKYIGKYAAERLSISKDDRCDWHKAKKDAQLRGHIGVHNANKIIAKIDEIKSWR